MNDTQILNWLERMFPRNPGRGRAMILHDPKENEWWLCFKDNHTVHAPTLREAVQQALALPDEAPAEIPGNTIPGGPGSAERSQSQPPVSEELT